MAELSPSQLQARERVERLIALASPALDLVLTIGDRVSRIVQPEDHDYYPPRPLESREPMPAAPPDAVSDPQDEA